MHDVLHANRGNDLMAAQSVSYPRSTGFEKEHIHEVMRVRFGLDKHLRGGFGDDITGASPRSRGRAVNAPVRYCRYAPSASKDHRAVCFEPNDVRVRR